MDDKASHTYQQQRQRVGQQINASGDVSIHHHTAAGVQAGEFRRDPIQAIESEFGQDLRALKRWYVTPDLQDFNPPDELNSPSLIVSRQPAFQVIDDFIARPGLADGGQRCLFVLGDAGMGKTSLLLMLACHRLSKPQTDGMDCLLIKLGPDALDRIATVPNPARTLLLLDSLDEDPSAHDHGGGAQGRLLDLLPAVSKFNRVILTCRSQFFPENSPHLTTLPAHFVVGNYECPLKYMSLFNDKQVEDYLARRYQPRFLGRIIRAFAGTEDPNLTEARKAAKAMESLRLRPLLLSRIDDFVGGEDQPRVDFRNSYAVYHRLVDQWLMRDAQKPAGMTLDESWRVAVLLALHLTRNGQRRIGREELAAIDGLRGIHRFKLEARSLLNRNKDGEYQFAHTTIQEFLLAHAILHPEECFHVARLMISPEAFRFLRDGNKFLGRKTLHLHGANADFPEAAIQWVGLTLGLEMVSLPAGEFLMGSPEFESGRSDAERQHKVRLTRPFWIGRYQVTQSEYLAVMGRNPSEFKGARRPVENVTWDDATAFCARLTARAHAEGCLQEGLIFRLPTEAEWEYACRAGTSSAFNDGSNCTTPDGKDPALAHLGWFRDNGNQQTHPVGEKAPNAWGLCDMHGNVWEWCFDGLRSYAVGVEVDPLGPTYPGAARTVRGGSWTDPAGICRAAFRVGNGPAALGSLLGFRLLVGRVPGLGKPVAPESGISAARPAGGASLS